MAVVSLRSAMFLVAVSLASVQASAQSFGLAAGPVAERGGTTGGLLQLSYFAPTAFSHIGVRLDGLMTAQPGEFIEGTDATGQNASFQEPTSHVYGLLGVVSYRVGRRSIQPYALFGTGFYSRNAWSSGFTIGMNAGLGADVRVRGVRLFTEARMHMFRGPENVRWTSPDQVRLFPVTVGVRF